MTSNLLITALLWVAAISLVYGALKARQGVVQATALGAALAAFVVGVVALALLAGCPPAASPSPRALSYATELEACLAVSKTRPEYDACEADVDTRYGRGREAGK